MRVAALRALRAENALDASLWPSSPPGRRPCGASSRSRSATCRSTCAGRRSTMLAQAYDGEDRFYLEAIGIGAQGKEAELVAGALLAPRRA